VRQSLRREHSGTGGHQIWHFRSLNGREYSHVSMALTGDALAKLESAF
jgi:hypothetical protein